MNELLHFASLFSASASGALFSAIWEGAVLAGCVLICLRLLPGLSAAARSVIWLNVFVLLLLLHFVPAFTGRFTPVANGGVPAVHPAFYLDLRWSLAVASLWLALSVWRGVQFIVGCLHMRQLARRAVPVPVDGDLQSLLAEAPGGRGAVLCRSDEVARPSVLGFFRPRILVPPALIETLSAPELRQVVQHEMEHLRRADDWTNLLQKIALVLFPLNPVLLWVERRLCAERELACDDRVVRSSASRKAYALCLTHLAEYALLRRSFSLVLGAWERRPELVRRIHRILRQPVNSMGRRPAAFATGGLLAGALGCAVVLSHSPQLVSFVPAHPAMRPVQAIGAMDVHEVSRALGGTPQFVKAKLSERAVTQKKVHSAVLKKANHRRPPASQVAALTPDPLPRPLLDQRALVVFTEWTSYETQSRVVFAVSTDRRANFAAGSATAPAMNPGAGPLPKAGMTQGAGPRTGPGSTPAAVAIPATYAIVPTPQGWLIIQI